MKHLEIKALLEEFSLGTLGDREHRLVVEHLESGCAECVRLVGEYQSVLGLMGLDCAPMEPPPELREKILIRISHIDKKNGAAPKALPDSHLVLSAEGTWKTLFSGIEMKTLFIDSESGYRTAVLKMAPGAELPRHVHHGEEEVFVVDGSCEYEGIHYSKGDYWHVGSGFVHETTYTEDGCTLLARFLQVKFDLP